MKIDRQLALFLENKPGTLAAVCQALADQNINIHAISISDAVDHAVVRMVVSDPTKAMHLLGEHGVLVVEREVLTVEGRSRPGELARIAKKLADHKINIEYAYSATPPETSTGAMILRVDNTAKAKRILRGY
ncbi:MAG TPA: ACT domain-containing protein [Verrucomicrobiae bacterium]|nr:ACT domain-containing protein [Verrucomicrobiae bacterium]